MITAHYKFDDNAASTTVVATVGSDGTLNGGDTTADKSTAGPGGSIPAGLDLNGSDDSITFAGWTLNTGWTGSASIWFRRDAEVAFGRIFGHASFAPNHYIATASDTQILVRLQAVNLYFAVPSMGTTWHHLLVTKTSSNTYRVFLDGVESSTGAQTNGASFNSLSVVGSGYTAVAPFNGAFAQFKIFDSDESANAAALYAEGVSSGSVVSIVHNDQVHRR